MCISPSVVLEGFYGGLLEVHWNPGEGRGPFACQFSQATTQRATMLVILVLEMILDGLSSSAAKRLRARRGLA